MFARVGFLVKCRQLCFATELAFTVVVERTGVFAECKEYFSCNLCFIISKLDGMVREMTVLFLTRYIRN